MIDRAFTHPIVEIVAASPRKEMISGRLRAAGFAPSEPREDVRPNDVLLVDAASVSEDLLRSLDYRLRRMPDRPFVLLGTSPVNLGRVDIHLATDRDLMDLPHHISKFERNWLVRNEIALRETTSAALGRFSPRPGFDSGTEFKVLYIGSGSPRLLGLRSELQCHDIHVTPTLSLLTARDALQSKDFNSIIVDLTDRDDLGHRFLRDQTLTNLPIIALTDPQHSLSDKDLRALLKVDECIDASEDISDLAHRVALSITSHDASVQLGEQVAEAFQLPGTSLFSKTFFDRHLENQMKQCEVYETPLSLITFNLRPKDEGSILNHATFSDFSQQLASMTRRTDCLGLIAPNTIAVSLRQTGFAGACKVGEMVAAHHSEHSNISETSTSLIWRAVERRLYHKTAHELIGAALDKPYRPQRTTAA